jgi:hypothetical protein
MDEIPEWLWRVIEQTKPSSEKLIQWFESVEKERIVQFYVAFDYASQEISDYSAGVRIDNYVFSEDSMEDLCDWIVSQGKDLWEQSTGETADLVAIARIYLDVENDPNAKYPKWFPQTIAHRFYYKHFNEAIFDAAAEFEDRLWNSSANWLEDDSEQN